MKNQMFSKSRMILKLALMVNKLINILRYRVGALVVFRWLVCVCVCVCVWVGGWVGGWVCGWVCVWVGVCVGGCLVCV